MGIFQSIAELFYSRPQVQFSLSIIGFHDAGKTTIVEKMKLTGGDKNAEPEMMATTPTIGCNMEEIHVNNLSIKMWDLSGQEKLRKTWKIYYEAVNGIIFVIDASNKDAMPDVRDTLHQVITETADLKLPILIFANK